MYTLIIIDMQQRFYVTDITPVTACVRREIEQAMKDEAPIICVEYSNCGKTLDSLYSLFKDYPRGHVIEKAFVDGSAEIVAFLKGKDYPMNFHITGVNTSACVFMTVEGLTQKLPESKLDIIYDACADMRQINEQDWEWHDKAMDRFRAMYNVTIVKSEK